MGSLQAMFGRAILKLDPKDDMIGLIHIPDPAQEQKLSGKVVSVGPGSVDQYGVFHPTQLKVGDRVIFGRHLGFNIKFEGETFYCILQRAIEAVFEKQEDTQEFPEDVPEPVEYLYTHLDHVEESELYLRLLDQGWKTKTIRKADGIILRMQRTAPTRYAGGDYARYLTYEETPPEQRVPGQVYIGVQQIELAEKPFNPFESTVKVDLETVQLDEQVEYDIALLNLACHHNEPDSPEWKEYERRKKAGWEDCDVDMNASVMYVRSMRRPKQS